MPARVHFSPDEFYYRWFKNSVIEICKTLYFLLIQGLYKLDGFHFERLKLKNDQDMNESSNFYLLSCVKPSKTKLVVEQFGASKGQFVEQLGILRQFQRGKSLKGPTAGHSFLWSYHPDS